MLTVCLWHYYCLYASIMKCGNPQIYREALQLGEFAFEDETKWTKFCRRHFFFMNGNSWYKFLQEKVHKGPIYKKPAPVQNRLHMWQDIIWINGGLIYQRIYVSNIRRQWVKPYQYINLSRCISEFRIVTNSKVFILINDPKRELHRSVKSVPGSMWLELLNCAAADKNDPPPPQLYCSR